ncbi:MAG: von Willebrand factor type A domain-containing protein, partial [Candidatus Zixiibacteriota bacterium]
MKQAVLIWIVIAVGMALGVLVDVTCAADQTGTITGNVVNSRTAEPVAKLSVLLVETGAVAVTDSRGRFTFDAVPTGVYELRIESTGFERKQVTGITVSNGVTTRVSVVLVPIAEKDKGENGPNRMRGYAAQNSQGAADSEYKNDRAGDSKAALSIKPMPDAQVAPSVVAQSPGLSKEYSRNYQDQKLQEVPRRAPDRTYSYEIIPPAPQDMFFRDYGTNGFVETRRDPRSTFAADIDDASYTLARRYLTEGNMPPSDAIRVEEFLNHFDYNYNPPEEGKFRIFSELATSPFDSRATYLKIGIKGREIAESRRKPMRLTAVIDVSGSMGYDNRFEVLKHSMASLVSRLDSDDRIAIVSYGSYATEVLAPTSGNRQGDIISALYSLYPGGST